MTIFVDTGEITICDGWGPERKVDFVLCCHCEATIPYTQKNGVKHYFTPQQPFCPKCNRLQCEQCAKLPCNPIDWRVEQALVKGQRIKEQRRG